MKNKGFTLIELLVIIAIIGILGSVVLSSVNTRKEEESSSSATTTSKPIVVTVKSSDVSYDETPMSRATNSCVLDIAKERDLMQERFAMEMEDLDNKVQKRCFGTDN